MVSMFSNIAQALDNLFDDPSDFAALNALADWVAPEEEEASEDASSGDAPLQTPPDVPPPTDVQTPAPTTDGGADVPPVGDIAQPADSYAKNALGFYLYGGLSFSALPGPPVPGPGPIDVPDVIGDDPPPAGHQAPAGWML